MINRATKLRWRRKIRRGHYRAQDAGQQADEHLERHFLKRLSRVKIVRRFILGWVSLLLLLIVGLTLQIRSLSRYYQVIEPVGGGQYVEGVLGSFTNANPIYATGAVDSAVTKLVFSGLLKYDQNNKLVTDLAESITHDERETTYTVKLRPNLKWHDSQPLTAADVVFTFKTIQNPDAKSPLNSSWLGITVEQVDGLTVSFKLPGALSAFPNSLTTGIIPSHLLASTPAPQLRSLAFNTVQPIGSGPFKWQTIEVSEGENILERNQRIGLVGFNEYQLGPPRINKFVFQTFNDEKKLFGSLINKEVHAAAGLNSLPKDYVLDSSIEEYNIPLTGGVFAFFNNSNDLLKDLSLRRAMVLAAKPKTILSSIGFPAKVLNEPLLKKQVGYNPSLAQLSDNPDEANKILDSINWPIDPATGIRAKDGRPLSLKLYTKTDNEYPVVAQLLQEQWRKVGIAVEVNLLSDQDLQNAIAFHSYDILLHGISIGNDPDVFAYWHSSQADIRSANRLNLSEYKSAVADKALEAGRTRSDPALRTVKYQPFLEAWRADNPALALYQPRYLYFVRKPLYNFNPAEINQSSDRFSNVHNWMIREDKTTK